MNRTIKHSVKFIKLISPKIVKRYISGKIDKRRYTEATARYKRTKVSKEELAAVLDTIDWNHDILLHASTINIGRIVGGANEVVRQILERFNTKEHTLLVTALPYFGSFAEYLTDDYIFDVNTAPNAMGVVCEKITALPGARRSVHPTHSVVALGKDAEWYTGSHHLDTTPFGVNSPYRKLLKNDGEVVLFGATADNLTIVHTLEDFYGEYFPVRNIYNKNRYKIRCIDSENRQLIVETPVHNPFTAIRRDDHTIWDSALKEGIVKAVPLGEGYVCSFLSRQYLRRMSDALAHGQTIYGRYHKALNIKDIEEMFS